MTILHDILSRFNLHDRDANLVFEPKSHKYTIMIDPSSNYTSVTTWNHSHFTEFDADGIIKKMINGKSWKEGHKYWGLTVQEIKTLWSNNASIASSAGTVIHYEIECFMNNPRLKHNYTHKELYDDYSAQTNQEQSLEWSYFLEFVKDFPNLKPYRSEWMIYCEELKLAGSIDMVYENTDGTLSIYDWKRAANITKTTAWNKFALTKCISHLPDTNYWHYALQLNTYKSILESKYCKKVTHLYLVKLHPENNDKSYEMIEVPILEKEIGFLFEERKQSIFF